MPFFSVLLYFKGSSIRTKPEILSNEKSHISLALRFVKSELTEQKAANECVLIKIIETLQDVCI